MYDTNYGDVVELVDTRDSNSRAARRNGSSPFIPTKLLILVTLLLFSCSNDPRKKDKEDVLDL